jgi:adenosylcobinamide kinase/adenosylcobinamide-phosphate guanylyltransferase
MPPEPRFVLITGGARSGKSRHAEARLRELAPDGPRHYFATLEPLDEEMRLRIERHRAHRGEGWCTVEVPLDLPGALRRELATGGAALVDCVTLWLSNRMLAGASDDELGADVDQIVAAVRAHAATVVMVTNEVGAGIVPDNALARRFRDVAGLANQRLAAAADEVVLVTCGLPLRLR